MVNMKKALLATAISVAISGSAQAGIQQLKIANGHSVYDVLSNLTATLDEQEQQPSAWYVLLNSAATTEAISGKHFNIQQAQQISLQTEALQQQVSQQLILLDADAEILTTTKHLAAGLVVSASAEALTALRNNPLVADIMPLYDSELHVADSAEYIKAVQVVQAGKASGEGVRVAILDTGIDYTHTIFGGEGTAAAYAAAVADQTSVPVWPKGQVVGGYDYLNNDPNPIDPPTGGHGTSVAHSVTGIAPDVSLYAYTVCAGTCPAVAQIGALEAAMDPNGDGNLDDRVDIINMSLGGQFGSTATQSGTQFLIQRAVNLGVNMVISAGNDGNVPFRIAGPSTTPNALSVGAMTHPAAAVGVLETALLDDASVVMVAAGFNPSLDFDITSAETPLVVIPGDYNACSALDESVDLSGKAVLVSRGVCAFVDKVKVAQARGAEFVIIANSNPGEAPIVAGGDNDGSITIPAVMVTKEVGDEVKARLDAGEVVSYAVKSVAKSGAGAIASFTSRGPSMDGLLKPEITAPGVAIQVARVATGTGTAPVNGTSFSGPITAGAVALARGGLPERNASEIKATLMNTANLEVYRQPIDINPDAPLAPISLIGAGLVDVEKAVNSPVAAWVYEAAFNTNQAALSFGLQTLDKVSSTTKTVTLKNFSDVARTYSLSINERFSEKAELGALSWGIPETVTVPANQAIQFDVTLTVDPAKLPEFKLANGVYWQPLTAAAQLDEVEFDGALVFNDTATEGEHDLHLVYHIIPKATGKLELLPGELIGSTSVPRVANTGVVPVRAFASTLVTTSPVNPALLPQHDIRAISFDIDAASFCASGYALYPTIHLEGGVSHLLQGNYAIDLDVNNDGTFDFTMNTLLLTRLGDAYSASPGVMVSFNTRYGTTSGSIADVFHYAGGKQVTLESCFNSVGLTAADIGRTITARFRTSADGSSLVASNIADSVIAPVQLQFSPEITLAESPAVAEPTAVTPQDTEEDKPKGTLLQPGEVAYIVREPGDNRSFVLLSADADAVAVADLQSAIAEPVVLSGQTFSVEENTAAGTVIGYVQATSDFRTAITEFVILGSTSNAISVKTDGEIVVTGELDYESGLTAVQFEVAALDTGGNVSAPATIVVDIVNLPDTPPVVTANVSQSSVASGTAAGTVLGAVSVNVKEAGATLSSITSNNNLFAVQNGQIILTRVPAKGDARVHSVTLTAVDSAGLQSTATAQIEVTHKSSGSFGFISLLLLPLLLLRRRSGK